jgi:hypothetical protein
MKDFNSKADFMNEFLGDYLPFGFQFQDSDFKDDISEQIDEEGRLVIERDGKVYRFSKKWVDHEGKD